MTAARQSPSIEFIVKPREDLYLQSTLRKLLRVHKGEPYPCQMQKNQTFSCLFRHYAKHNGLRKEDLVFYFVDELLPDQMPETVYLMPQDEIWVELRKPIEKEKTPTKDVKFFQEQFRVIFENASSSHSDIIFRVGDLNEEVSAHKAILSARSEYFAAMFRKGGMCESLQNVVEIKGYDKVTFTRMLEYVYTNTIKSIESFPNMDIIALLQIANEYCLQDLQILIEQAASKMLNSENIGKFLFVSGKFNAATLLEECKLFVRENKTSLSQDEKFRMEIEASPQLGLMLFDAMLEDGNDAAPTSKKRRRVTEQFVHPTGDLHELVPAHAGETNTIADGAPPPATGADPW